MPVATVKFGVTNWRFAWHYARHFPQALSRTQLFKWQRSFQGMSTVRSVSEVAAKQCESLCRRHETFVMNAYKGCCEDSERSQCSDRFKDNLLHARKHRFVPCHGLSRCCEMICLQTGDNWLMNKANKNGVKSHIKNGIRFSWYQRRNWASGFQIGKYQYEQSIAIIFT